MTSPAVGGMSNLPHSKTVYITDDGRTTFFLPDRSQHSVKATDVDHPTSICIILDMLAALTQVERRLIARAANDTKHPPADGTQTIPDESQNSHR